jgi:hypothetical protein
MASAFNGYHAVCGRTSWSIRYEPSACIFCDELIDLGRYPDPRYSSESRDKDQGAGTPRPVENRGDRTSRSRMVVRGGLLPPGGARGPASVRIR